MKILLGALLSGLVFGFGLVISGMTQPAKVLGFLDIFGTWDPTLAFVMGGALAVAIPGFYLARGRKRPLLAPQFRWPTRNEIDAKLVGGAAIFGVGWGLAGFCPGPVLVGAAAGLADAWVFVPAMVAGSWIAGRLFTR